jgi:hypothetical protein
MNKQPLCHKEGHAFVTLSKFGTSSEVKSGAKPHTASFCVRQNKETVDNRSRDALSSVASHEVEMFLGSIN